MTLSREAPRLCDLMRQGFWKMADSYRFDEAEARIRAWEEAHGRKLTRQDADFPWERRSAFRSAAHAILNRAATSAGG